MTKASIEEIRELLKLQGNSDPQNEDSYMRGLYNGLELALSVLENREPVYRRKAAEKTSTDPLGIRGDTLKFRRHTPYVPRVRNEPLSYGMDVGAPGDDESFVAFYHSDPWTWTELWNPRTIEDPFVASYHPNWADEMRMLEDQAKWVPTSDYFKEQLRDDVLVTNGYQPYEPSPAILQLIEDSRARLEESCGLRANIEARWWREFGFFSGRREGKTTSMLEAMKSAMMDALVQESVMSVAPPVVLDLKQGDNTRVVIVGGGGGSGGSGKAPTFHGDCAAAGAASAGSCNALTFHGGAGNATQVPCAQAIEDTDEPSGDREMDIVRSMCKGTW